MARQLDPLFVDSTSIDWALKHTQRFGDTDIFPVPFEYEAFAAVWQKVRAYLEKVDIANAEAAGTWKMMVPKHTYGFRGATQLGPLDHLLYTALVHSNAAAIETFRRPKKEGVACAYRLELDPEGRLFGKDTGWGQFHEQSELLAVGGCSDPSDCSFVVCADIADFYNQISHHRIQGALEQANIGSNASHVTERLLGNVNAKHHSRGIPVGPAVSVLLAEACLADVDNFLRRKYRHTRYVDDFRIFCTSEKEAIDALHDLSEYLFVAHRLTLQTGKTRILEVDEFVAEELHDPEKEETEAKEVHIDALIEQMVDVDSGDYGEWIETDVKIDEAKVAHHVLEELFERVIDSSSLPLGLARYVLRRAATTRCRAILPAVLNNLDGLIPVLRDVINYLNKVSNEANCSDIGSELLALAIDSKFRSLPFVQYWILSAFQQTPAFVDAETALTLAERSNPIIRDRMAALTARSFRIVDWVRWKKESWGNTSAWAQKAIVWASAILPSDERGHWLQPIRNDSNREIGFVADAVFALGKR